MTPAGVTEALENGVSDTLKTWPLIVAVIDAVPVSVACVRVA